MDLVVFAPIGLVTSAREELPALAAKGRERLELQLHNARIVGELVVTEGRKELERRFGDGHRPATGMADGRPATTPPAPLAGDEVRSAAPPRPSDAMSAGIGRVISDYDTLSASQVVRRLDGLSPTELEAVRRYEAAGRQRRTILSRVDELAGCFDGDVPSRES